MAQPTPYTPEADFSADEADNVGGRSTVRTAGLDAELAAIETTLDGILANLALNQRDDGNIRDLRVKLFTLGADVRALLAAGQGLPRGAWATGVAYALRDLVTQDGNTYICAVAHTAGTFATDLAAVRWLLLALDAGVSAAGIPFTPTATIAATNVQAAIEEADGEARSQITALANDLANTVNPAKGAALVGYSDALTYPDGTVGAKLATIGTGGGTGGGGTGEAWVSGDNTGVASINAGILAAQSAAQNIAFAPGTYRVTADLTITSAVRFLKGARVLIDSGVTLTINGQLDAGLWQIFSTSGTGKVVLAQASTIITVPEWWGASPSASASVNSATFQACVYQSYGKFMHVRQSGYPISGFIIPPIAESGTSQLPFRMIGFGVDGNAGTGGCSLLWDHTAHCIDLTNAGSVNSDNSIVIEGIHIVGTGAADPGSTATPHNAFHCVRANNLVLRGVQATKCPQAGIYLERCYGTTISGATLLENGWYGIWAFKQANIVRMEDIKSYRNGKVYDRLCANVYFNGGSTFESLGPVLDNVDVSYSGNAGTLYRRSNSSLTSIVVTSGVATATTAAAHGRTTGDQIAVVGCASQDQLNTVFPATITVTSTTAFTWSTPAPNGTYTDATMTIGPCSYGLLMQDVQGARIHAYAEDCMGPALYLSPTVTASIVEGGYWQGVDFGGLVLLDDCSNVELGAMRFFGANAKLYMGITARKHGVNLKSSVTFGNNAKLVEPTSIRLRDGAYFASSSPSVLNAGGVWLHGDVVRYLTPNINSVRGYVCSAPPNTWIADGDFIDDV